MKTYEYIVGDKKITLFNPCPSCRKIELRIITGEIPLPLYIPVPSLRCRCWNPFVDVEEEE